MVVDNRDQIELLITQLADFYNKTLTDTFLDMYAEAIQEYTTFEIKQAIRKCVKECVFFPVPAELIKRIMELPSELQHHALAAAEQIIACIHEPSPEFLDDTINEIISENGGWDVVQKKIKSSDPSGVKWVLVDAYKRRATAKKQKLSEGDQYKKLKQLTEGIG